MYDSWANLLQKNVTAGSAETLSVSVTAKNQILNSPFTYDADGSLVNDGSDTYVYGAENRMTTGGTATYTFDGDSLRVRKLDSQNARTTAFIGAELACRFWPRATSPAIRKRI